MASGNVAGTLWRSIIALWWWRAWQTATPDRQLRFGSAPHYRHFVVVVVILVSKWVFQTAVLEIPCPVW